MAEHTVTLLRRAKTRLCGILSKLYASHHFFPFICLCILLLLTVLRINGSSVGLYNDVFNGTASRDTSQLLNHARGVRSDEFLYVTPLTIGQEEQGFPKVNTDIGSGQDVSVIIDTPYREWSAFFKPQNFAFFVLPLEYAFAFKWWLLAFVLIVSCYYFVLKLLPGKRLWAASIAIVVLFSPFIQWWYQTITLATLAYCFLLATLVISIFQSRNVKHQILYGLATSYVITALIMLMYPPFQLPCALATGLFLIGWLWSQRQKLAPRLLKRGLIISITAVLVAGGIMALFVATRPQLISTIQNTAYPGKRIVPAGGFDPQLFLGSHLDIQLQSDARAAHYFNNQSEASSFLMLSPFLLLPSGWFIVRAWRQNRQILWPLIAVNAVLLLFLGRLFVPHFNFIYKILQLASIPHNRLLLAIGLVGILQLVLLITYRQKKNSALLRYLTAGLVFTLLTLVGLWTMHTYPGFIMGGWEVILLSAAAGGIAYLVLGSDRQITIGLIIFALFTVASTAYANPLYRGLGELTHGQLVQAIAMTGSAQDRWAVADSRVLVSLPLAAGKPALTGVYTYPQKNLWQTIDHSPTATNTYNRFAHVIVSLQPETDASLPAILNLGAEDYFTIQTNTCGQAFKEFRVSYLLTATPILRPQCATLEQTIHYAASDYYIYKLQRH